MKLIIVESPTKSKTLTGFLDKEYKILSSYGHVRDLPIRKLGIDVDHDFEPEYVIPTKAKKVVKELKAAAKKADLIILATDKDREGEAIAWHIVHALKIDKDYQRIAFHEITKKAIEKALKNPGEIDMDLVNAQQARRILDRLVGYKLSPFLWKKVVKGLSAGRVQSVTVKLIIDREREIKAFKPDEYWGIEAILKQNKEKTELVAKLIKEDEKTIPKLGIKTKEKADEILKSLAGAKYQIVNIEKKETKKNPGPPFKTSTLQQVAASKFRFSAKQTMRLAQQLYESGRITYHRTDSLNLSTEALEDANQFIKEEFGEKYLLDKVRVYKTKSKVAQEAHEAIRPTKASRHPDQIKKYLDEKQYKLYNLIWQRFIASQMKPAILDATAIDVSAKNYLFRINGSTIKFDGFLKIYSVKMEEVILPVLTEKEILELIKLNSEQHFTKPPARYTEASLVKILEKHDIGRPSTYASIISTIQNRGYTEKDEQKRFVPTEIGFIVNDLLEKHFPEIVDIKFTAYLEEDLDKVAHGKQNWVKLLKDFYKPFKENLDKKYKKVEKKKLEEPTDKICPDCGKNMVIKLGRFGKFYACPGFPECKHTEPIIHSTGVKCPQCKKGDLIERKTRKGKTFYSCSKYPKCKFALWDKPVNEKCSKCGSLLVETKNNKTKCSNKECNKNNV
ncbi:MAG: type I DNA topoisomerase [Candidatus Portnoybacteria bacterium]|nr:type I DNA topoisomerase [Candidatus Portnoybacteria bacterium]